jgi:hypothetical protein
MNFFITLLENVNKSRTSANNVSLKSEVHSELAHHGVKRVRILRRVPWAVALGGSPFACTRLQSFEADWGQRRATMRECDFERHTHHVTRLLPVDAVSTPQGPWVKTGNIT